MYLVSKARTLICFCLICPYTNVLHCLQLTSRVLSWLNMSVTIKEAFASQWLLMPVSIFSTWGNWPASESWSCYPVHQCKLRLAVREADGREGCWKAVGEERRRWCVGADGLSPPLLDPHQLSQSLSTPCTLGQHRCLPLLALCWLPLLGGHRLNWALVC